MFKCVSKNNLDSISIQHQARVSPKGVLYSDPLLPFFGSCQSLQDYFLPRSSIQSIYARLEKLSVHLLLNGQLSPFSKSDLETDEKLALFLCAWRVSPTRLVALHGFCVIC